MSTDNEILKNFLLVSKLRTDAIEAERRKQAMLERAGEDCRAGKIDPAELRSFEEAYTEAVQRRLRIQGVYDLISKPKARKRNES